MWTTEQKRAYDKQWRKNNLDKVRRARKKWREKNRDRINAQKRAWHKKNKDKVNEVRRKRESTPEVKAKRAIQRRNYNPSPEIKKRWAEKTRKHARKRKEQAVALLGGLCSICGIKDHPAIYDFHHRDPLEKDMAISRTRSWAKMREELLKCQLVCANCHRKLHWVD